MQLKKRVKTSKTDAKLNIAYKIMPFSQVWTPVFANRIAQNMKNQILQTSAKMTKDISSAVLGIILLQFSLNHIIIILVGFLLNKKLEKQSFRFVSMNI